MTNTLGHDILGGSRFFAGFQFLLKRVLPSSFASWDQEVTVQSLSAVTAAAVLTNSLLLMHLGHPFSIQGILGRMVLLSLGVAGWGIKRDWKQMIRESLFLQKAGQFLRWIR